MSELHFKGKEFVFNHHLTVPYRPLTPHAEKSIVAAGQAPRLDDNLVVHGDNLHALKALLPMYSGKVDCIFIDPPYNTGNEGWAYSDNVNSPYIKEWMSENPINKDDMLRHDKWLCMMWPRLKLLHELLADTGSFWMTLDDNEVHRAKMMCDEIFGEDNFVANFLWRKKSTSTNVRGAVVSSLTDHVLCYSKSANNKLNPRVTEANSRTYPHNDAAGNYRVSVIEKKDAGGYARETMKFNILGQPPRDGKRWQIGEVTARELESKNRFFVEDSLVKLKIYEADEVDSFSAQPTLLLNHGTTDGAGKMLSAIFNQPEVFDNPKPYELVKHCIELSCGDESIVLDSFAGSGTTAHAVLALNAEDGGSRKFILCEGEDYADTLTAERVRRVMQGYAYTGKQKTELLRQPLNFTALKNADKLLDKIAAIENLHAHEYDRINKTVKNDALLVVGEKDVESKTKGLGGTFTYCSLGEPVDLNTLLSGENLPTFEQLGSWLFNTATNQAFDPARMNEAQCYLGESASYHVWLYYRPDMVWLKSRESALTLNKAQSLALAMPFEATGKKHLVFAPAKFAPNKTLAPLHIEHAPLPFALFRIER